MTIWASLLAGLAKLAGLVMAYINNRQLLDAGEARGVARLSAEERERVDAANRAALRARDTDRLPDDAYRD
jgi:hypothetical protein